MDDLYKNIEEYNPIFKNISFRIFEHEVWFTDQNSNPLEIEDKIDHFSYSLKYNIWNMTHYLDQLRDLFVKYW